MKITRRQLKKLVQEELANLYENHPGMDDEPAGVSGAGVEPAAAGELETGIEGELPGPEEEEPGDELTQLININRKLDLIMTNLQVEDVGDGSEEGLSV
jgi:hypothetical protein